MFKKRLVSAAAIATAATMVLAGCGGGGEEEPPGGGGSAATVDSLTVLDYYVDEPNHSRVGKLLSDMRHLDRCGEGRSPVRPWPDA